ncbi:hypothetical protein O181_022166 [Austropuccinia psidii MF-1]|uniref:PWWP domain-containing protein n=1 Tax=Austropuccinia psidii MF-1 TaxID=1389203 RepID=A0A9Q3CGW7_9BASI|nr:hypothetical protein [Austropuccinia psidii MF-1]
MPPKTPRQSGTSVATPGGTPAQLTYSYHDIVLAKVKGHPAWPARIIDPHVAPMNLRDERKIAQKNSYLVKFFKTADYAWMNAKEMSKLEPPEIRAFINNPNKKGADLKAAYQIALAPEAWEAELEAIARQYDEEQKALELDELEPTEVLEEAALAPLKPKPKRKRAPEPTKPTPKPKKRKSDVPPTNGSANTSATPEPASTPGGKKRGKKKEVRIIDGESVVRNWRHRLQRVFLGKSEATEKMMPEIDDVFKDIEAFEMKTEWLTASKLGKVLKRIGVLDDSKIPSNYKYNIKARAQALQEKWRQTLGFAEDPSKQTTGSNNQLDVNQKVADDTVNMEPKEKGSNGHGLDAIKTQSDENLPGEVEGETETKSTPDTKEVSTPNEIGPISLPSPPALAEFNPPKVNGDHPKKVQEATNGDEKTQDMETDSLKPDPASIDGLETEEKDNDSEQMDCNESPEAASVENNQEAVNQVEKEGEA